MVNNDSNKSFSKTIAGILIFTAVITIFVAFVLGVMGTKIFSDKGVQAENTRTPYVVENSNSEQSLLLSNNSGNHNDVPVADKHEQEHDTVPGCISVEQKNIPYELPICITQETIDAWWILYKVCGGYVPSVETWIRDAQGNIIRSVRPNYGWIILDQDKTPEGGIILMTEMEIIQDTTLPCCSYYVNISGFVLFNDQEIHLDSNHLPRGPIEETGKEYDGDLDKLVQLDIITNWEGCHLDKQEFRLILAQKNYISGIPNSRNNI